MVNSLHPAPLNPCHHAADVRRDDRSRSPKRLTAYRRLTMNKNRTLQSRFTLMCSIACLTLVPTLAKATIPTDNEPPQTVGANSYASFESAAFNLGAQTCRQLSGTGSGTATQKSNGQGGQVNLVIYTCNTTAVKYVLTYVFWNEQPTHQCTFGGATATCIGT